MAQNTYKFSIPNGEWNIETGQQKREQWVRKFSEDTQAEQFARELSEAHGRVSVHIHRPDATWSVRSPYLGEWT